MAINTQPRDIPRIKKDSYIQQQQQSKQEMMSWLSGPVGLAGKSRKYHDINGTKDNHCNQCRNEAFGWMSILVQNHGETWRIA